MCRSFLLFVRAHTHARMWCLRVWVASAALESVHAYVRLWCMYMCARTCVCGGGGRFCVLASACVTYVFVRGILANFYLIPSKIIGARGRCKWKLLLKTSLTFKCLIEHLLADFSYSRPLDTYLWKQMMKMNRNITYKWCNIAKKHLLFTKRKCHKFSWLFMASRYSPRRRSICACRIACKVLVSIGF